MLKHLKMNLKNKNSKLISLLIDDEKLLKNIKPFGLLAKY